MQLERQLLIRSLFDQYIERYASRDDRLTEWFSDNFSGYTGGGEFLVKDRDEWVKITRLDFSQVKGRIRIELLDLVMQDISHDVVVVTALFHIHLPIPEQILSRETARLVLTFRLEGEDWKIVHSGISVPYRGVDEGEGYPIRGLQERNRELETLVGKRTQALEGANKKLDILSNTDWWVNPGFELSPSFIDKRPQQRLDLCASQQPRGQNRVTSVKIRGWPKV
jgi:hypothetical protein